MIAPAGIEMPEILLFTKPDCQKCDYVKERLPDGLIISIVDTTTAEGLAEAAYYELLNKNTPILVVDDEVFEGAIVIMNKLKALAAR
jgi:deoxyxylulose-5-phosphate synthase